MKTISTLSKILLFLLFSFSNSAHASHLMGGDITYKWLGGKKYEFTFTIYRDCRGIPFNSPSITMFQKGGVNNTSVNYTRTSIKDITNICDDTSIKRPCLPENTTANEGIEEHIFVANVDFGSSPFNIFDDTNSCEVYIKLEQCCRNGAINTLSPANFYIESMLNLCNSNYVNSSPKFYDVGTLVAFCGEPFLANFSGYDFVDFDSVSYELVNPLSASNTNIGYTGNFSKDIPMTPYCPPNPGTLNCKPLPNAKPPRGFYFNENTGEIKFTPIKCDEVGVISLKVNEFRKVNGKWLQIGYSIRDVQIIVKNNPTLIINQLQVFLILYKFRTREKTCFEISTVDNKHQLQTDTANYGINTKIIVLNAPSGSTLEYLDSSVDNKTGRFC
ncbi:MAG: hypothetical protein R2852_06500 [Bacteroidia bacterium]